MTNNTRYNGWANYATWRINMEMFDGATLEDICGTVNWHEFDANVIGEQLKDYVYENFDSLALKFALVFVPDVNWYEIAEHLISAHIDAQSEGATLG